MIHITDGQSDKILDFITAKNIIDNKHRQSLKDNLETFEFRTFADKPFSQHLGKHNRVIIPAEDQGYQEFVIIESGKYRDTEGLKAEVYASASYLLLKKAKVIKPQTFTKQTATTAVSYATSDTEWRPGIIEGKGNRTFNIEEYTNPYAFLKLIAKEFNLELCFRVETDGNKVIGRYVDLLEKIGRWRGREVEFGKDLIGIRRTEKNDVYTALLGLGPEREDGTRLEVLVEDKDALQRWGRPDPITGELQHFIGTYEPQSSDQDMTLNRLKTLTENELEKRVNEVVEYESTIADLENVPGMENKKIRFGDTIKIKDTKFNPPLYLEARVHTQDRSITDKSKKQVTLGDYIEYTEEEVQAIWQSLQAEIRKKLARMLLISIETSAGDVFKNGEGSTALNARVFLTGNEVDEDGSFYSYYWSKRDKRGVPVAGWSKPGKSITVTADEIDEKATYSVEINKNGTLAISRITISNVFDGEDGQKGEKGDPGPQGIPGPPGEDGQSLYTWVKYADSPTSGMSDSPNGKKYIGLAYNKSTPTKSTNYADYEWAKIEGDQGVPGTPGKDGQPRYTWVKYADDKDGYGMSDSPDDKRYLGLAYNKTSATESSNPADYSWSPLYDNVKVGGRNLFSIDDFKRTKYPNESDVNLTSWKFQGDPNTEYTVNTSIPKGDTWYDLFFDKYPSSPSSSVNGVAAEEPRTITSDSTGMLELSFRSTDSNNPNWQDVVNGLFWVKLEKGNIATDWTPAPEDVDKAIEDAEQNAKQHAVEVSEAAYIDAINDAEDYMQKNGIMQGADYNGVSITHEEGFMTARADGLVRTVQNSTTGFVIQSRPSKTAAWKDVVYIDTEGNAKYAGDLEGASGTFGSVSVLNDDLNIQDDYTSTLYSVTPKRNILKDHSFELLRPDPDRTNQDYFDHNWSEIKSNSMWGVTFWEKVRDPKVTVQFAPASADALAIFGNRAAVVRNANYVRQYVYEGVGAGSVYTLSAHFKRQWNVRTGGIPLFQVWHIDEGGRRKAEIFTESFTPVRSDYKYERHASTFTVPDDFVTGDSLEVIVSALDDRWVQCDGIQMVEGDRASTYISDDAAWDFYNGLYRPLNEQRILWAGAAYPTDTQPVYPDLPLSECANGWIIEWHAYNPGSGFADTHYQYTYVPKVHGIYNSGHAMRIVLNRGRNDGDIYKYVYVYNDHLVGHAVNDDSPNSLIAMSAVYEF